MSSKEADRKTPAKQDKLSENEAKPTEIGGRKGPDPARYGDWELNGKCVDF
tara:strand:+ start:43 stop:195 length:153 start_codon:yes stop_codon:yes gene_type:complete